MKRLGEIIGFCSLKKYVVAFLASLCVCVGNAQEKDIDSIKCYHGPYGFVTVGNTNHQLKDKTVNSRNDEQKDIDTLNRAPSKGELVKAKNTNCNFADLYIDIPKEQACDGKLEIEYANLSWGARVKKGTANRNKVKVAMFSEGGDLLVENASLSADRLTDIEVRYEDRGLYTCHANVTNLIETGYKKGNGATKFKFYVANIVAATTEWGESKDIGMFSGWTLTVIYKHKGLADRAIYFYTPDVIGDVEGTATSTEGKDPEPLRCNFKIGRNFENLILNSDMSFVCSALGAYLKVNEKMVANLPTTSPSDIDERTNILPNSLPSAFSSNCRYEYDFATAGPLKVNLGYTRGYDLHTYRFNPYPNPKVITNTTCINKTAQTFSIAVPCKSELHCLMDVVLMFGEPDIPPAVIRDESPSGVKPNSPFKYPLYVPVNNNKEVLQDVKIRIPLSEYVKSITDLKITLYNSNYNNYNKNNLVGTWDNIEAKLLVKGDDGIYTERLTTATNYANWRDGKSSSTVKTNLNTINERLESLLNEQKTRFIAGQSLQQRVLEIKFPSLDAIGIKTDEAIKIELDLFSQPDTSWVYDKNRLANTSFNVSMQGEMTFTTNSGRTSVEEAYDKDDSFEWDDFICKQRLGLGDGGGGAGGGGGGGGGAGGGNPCSKSHYDDIYASPKGVRTKDVIHAVTDVTVSDRLDCHLDIPDTIQFSSCDIASITASDIKTKLKKTYHIDLDSLANYDEKVWLDARATALYQLAREHGVTRAEIEGLLKLDDVQAIVDTINKRAACTGLSITANDIDYWVNGEFKTTDITLFYKEENELAFYINTADVSAPTVPVSLHKDESAVWKFEKENMEEVAPGEFKKTLYAYFDSPWEHGICSKWIMVEIFVFNDQKPKVEYGEEKKLVEEGDEIVICNSSEIESFFVTKNAKKDEIVVKVGDNSEYSISVVPEPSVEWKISEKYIDTKIPLEKIYPVTVYAKDVNCKSEELHFTIRVTKDPIVKKPNLKVKGVELDTKDFYGLCMQDEPITLEIDEPDASYTTVWYVTDSTTHQIKEAEGETSFEVKVDTVYQWTYAVAYMNTTCKGDKGDALEVMTYPLPDTLAKDTMKICNGYELVVGDLPDAKYMTSTKIAPDTITLRYYTSNSSSATPTDKANMPAYLNNEGNAVGLRTNFYVAAVDTKHECEGKKQPWTIERVEYDNSKPKFPMGKNLDDVYVPIDSALVCLGATPNEDLKTYLAQEEQDLSDVKWQWYKNDKISYKYKPVNSNYADTKDVYSSDLKGDVAASDTFYVVRINEMGCVSDSVQFRLHVDSNITTKPFVDDLTVPRTNYSKVELFYCQNDNPYAPKSVIPTAPTETGYIVEWRQKDAADEEVDEYVKTDKYASVNFSKPGVSYYSVRQSTVLGCHGKWLPVEITVFPEIKVVPEYDPVELCLNEIPEPVIIKNFPSASDNFVLKFYDKALTELEDSDYTNTFTPNSSEAGVFSPVKAIFKSTEPHNVCKSTSVDITYKVHALPEKPTLGKSNVVTCFGKEQIDLVDLSQAKEKQDGKHYLYWDLPDTTGKIGGKTILDHVAYSVTQRNKETGCEGEAVEVTVSVDSTFSYKHFEVSLCYGDEIELYSKVGEQITEKTAVVTPNITHKVYPGLNANGTAVGATDLIKSPVARYDSKTLNYFVKVEDAVTGCVVQDTAVVTFNGLPTIASLDDIDTCSAATFKLPYIDESLYKEVAWYKKSDGEKIVGNTAALSASDNLKVVVTDDNDCKESKEITVTIHENPKKPSVIDATICKNYGEYQLDINVDATAGTENTSGKLGLYVRDENGDTLNEAKVNPDTLDMGSAKKKVFTYTVYQQNQFTTCYDSAFLKLTVHTPFTPDFKQIGPLCQPQEVNVKDTIVNYVFGNLNKIGVSDRENIVISYATASGTELSPEAASAITRAANNDTSMYSFTIADKDNVCSVENKFMVIINEIPKAPVIESGVDSIFLCNDGSPMYIKAEIMNIDKSNLEIHWEKEDSDIKGESYELKSDIENVKAYVRNEKTLCVSKPDDIDIAVVPTMVVTPHKPITLCAGVEANILDTLKATFKYNPVYRSKVTYSATENGDFIDTTVMKSLTKTVLTTKTYELTMTDLLTGCTASNSVEVTWIDPVANTIVSKPFACQKDTAIFLENGETRPHSVEWKIGDTRVSTESSFQYVNLVDDVTIQLVTYITGTQCSATTDYTLKVYKTPEALSIPNNQFIFCQGTPDEDITLDHEAGYKLEWTKPDNSVLENEYFSVNKTDADTFSLLVRQINKFKDPVTYKDSVCRSLPKDIDVNIVKHIDIAIKDTNVCSPDSLDMESEVSRIGELFGVDKVSITPAPADPSDVRVGGDYTILYKDRNECETSAIWKVKFIPKPPVVGILKNNFNMCLGDELTVKTDPVLGPYKIEWSDDYGKMYSDTIHIADPLPVENKTYDVVRIDTVFNCVSDPTKFIYSVKDSIHQNTIFAQHICDNDVIDLDSLGKTIFQNASDLTITFKETNGVVAYSAKNPVSTCKSEASVNIIKHNRPNLKVEGNRVACAGDTVVLNAIGDYDFTWQSVYGGSSFDVRSMKSVDSVISFRATLKEPIVAEKYCWKDSIIKVKFEILPELLAGNLDTFYCQNIDVNPLKLVPNNGATLWWYSPEDNYAAGVKNGLLTPNTKEAGVFTYKFKQVLGICTTKVQEYVVDVKPKLEVTLNDTNLCMPITYDLLANVSQENLKITSITPEPADREKVTESNRYIVAYKDTFGCTAEAMTKVKFVDKPKKVELTESDFNMCLGSETTIRPTVLRGPYRIEWFRDVLDDEFYQASDTFYIDAKVETDGKVIYKVARADTTYGCKSDTVTLSYAVLAPIVKNPVIDQHLCDYETIDLDSLGKTIFQKAEDLQISNTKKGGMVYYTALNPVSTCSAEDSVKIIEHQSPKLKVNGNRIVCSGDTVVLSAVGDYNFTWQNKEKGAVLNVMSDESVDSVIAFRATLKDPIVANKYCWRDSLIRVKFEVMPKLVGGKLDTIYCQYADVDPLKLLPDGNADLMWYSPEDNYSAYSLNGTLTPNTDKAGKFVYKFNQSLGICTTKMQEYGVVVMPKIEVSLKDTSLCMPAIYDLKANVAQRNLEITSITPMPADANKVTESHSYVIAYKDTLGCTAEATTKVKFIPKPSVVTLIENNFNVCVGSEAVVEPKPLMGAYRIEWFNNHETKVGDTIHLNTLKPTEEEPGLFNVVRVDTVFGCKSDTVQLSYNVMDVIKFNPIADQHICDYEVIDLDSLGNTLFKDADALNIKYTIKGNVVSYSADNPISTCSADTSLQIIKHQRPQLKVEGNHIACAGDTVTLVAVGDYDYTWQDKILGNTFEVMSKMSVDSSVTISAKLKDPIVGNKYCYSDSSFMVRFELVPAVYPLSALDTTYCQDSEVNPLNLKPTFNTATLVWYSEEDGYTNPIANRSLRPKTDKAGSFIYKFKQTLGICATKVQDYVVTIQPRIEEKPVVNDTAYCIDATPMPLTYSVIKPIAGYDVEWMDKDAIETLNPDNYPTTNEAGYQFYAVRYATGVCVGDTSIMRVAIERRTNASPIVEPLQRFCPNTGPQTLQAKITRPGARLNWYAAESLERKDSIVVDTDKEWESLTFTVTQSVLDGCESDPAEVVRVEKKTPVPLMETIRKDLCLGSNFIVDDLFNELKLDEILKIDKVKDAKREKIDHIITTDGVYYVDVHNDDECEAELSIAVKTWEVGTPKITAPKEIYCIGDSVKVTAVAPNEVEYRWFSKNQNTVIGYAETLKTRAGYETDSVFLTMSVSGHPECTATEKFEINVAPKLDFDILGDTALCIGNTFSLAANKITNIKWEFDGELYSTETFEFKPEKSGYVTAYGQDQYGCYTSKRALVKVYKSPVPSIIISDTVKSPKYDLDRDDRNIVFTAQVLSDENSELHYQWNVGDGNKYTDESFMHVYDYDFVNTIKPIPVTLRVAYDFDDMCAGQTAIVLRIDPDFHVPNTMTDGDVFMEHYDIQIFDRVGNLIYEGKEGWQGQDMNGKPVFGDTYFYAITYFIEGKKHVKNGYITLVRK